MVHETLLGVRRDDDRRHAAAGPPLVFGRRCNVVPEAAVLVIRDDHYCMRGLWAVLDVLEQLDHMVFADQHIGVAGVLVVLAQRLDERDSRQRARIGFGDEMGLVLEMHAFAGVPSA